MMKNRLAANLPPMKLGPAVAQLPLLLPVAVAAVGRPLPVAAFSCPWQCVLPVLQQAVRAAEVGRS